GNGQTRYTARALHWTKENREVHEKMGFHEGWGVATDQMTALARTL
ncbi:MAG TPA: polyketide cyclase, partial [Reyranella sp.]|nr:polyketide cyclase [Reyranella sp.]